jgi:hypothetical protein
MASENGKFVTEEGRGGAASKVWESTNTTFDVVHKYRWTLSNKLNPNQPDNLDEVPYAKLREYRVDESTIKTQLSYYLNGAGQLGQNAGTDLLDTGAGFINGLSNFAADTTNSFFGTNFQGTNIQGPEGNKDVNLLAPYEFLFPRNLTGNEYILPYFDEINFEVNTPQWQSLDTLEAGAKALESGAGILGGEGAASVVGGLLRGGAATAGALLAAAYPKIGIMDRPKLWQSHDYRTVQIKFPLFNTVSPDDWRKNRNLCWILVNQNLFTKRDFITGIPPVYYEVIIPGQHYSFAACVTNITIYNRGNMRKFKEPDGSDAIVPDAYEVSMTLTDMVMPSRNLFQSIQAESKKVTAQMVSTATNPPNASQAGSNTAQQAVAGFAAGNALLPGIGGVAGASFGAVAGALNFRPF